MGKGVLCKFPGGGVKAFERGCTGSILHIELQKLAANMAEDVTELEARRCGVGDRLRIARNLRAYKEYLELVSGAPA